jgi:hypothetical protein
VGVEKVQFPSKRLKIGGYKIPRKLRKSFVGHHSANLFWLVSRVGLFQHPRLLTSATFWLGARSHRARRLPRLRRGSSDRCSPAATQGLRKIRRLFRRPICGLVRPLAKDKSDLLRHPHQLFYCFAGFFQCLFIGHHRGCGSTARRCRDDIGEN